IRDFHVTGVQTCALPIFVHSENHWNESNNQWKTNGHNTRQQHFLKGSFGGNSHTFIVLWFASTFHNSWNFTELTSHFINHLHCSFTNRIHCQSRENNWNHTTHKKHR